MDRTQRLDLEMTMNATNGKLESSEIKSSMEGKFGKSSPVSKEKTQEMQMTEV